MTWPQIQLKYVTRFNYGEALPRNEENNIREGLIKVFGSNGPYDQHFHANTKAPAIIVGRKGSYGKINWSSEPCFASDTTFFIDNSTTHHFLRWIYYLLQTLRLDEGSSEAAVPGLNREDAYEKFVFVPPLVTQRAIAAYLDHETAKIDALIDAKQRLLTLLAEKRRAMITHAVTRGLDPSVPLRDSGVPWIGRMPKHWEMTNIKYVAQIGNGSTPRRDYMFYWQDGQFPWLTSTVVNNDIIGEPTEFVTDFALRECHLPIIKPNSVLVAITGEGKTRGKAAILPYEATINQHMAYISPFHQILHHEFLQRYLSGSYDILRMLSDGTGSTKGALTCEQLGDFLVPLPPIAEQIAIIATLKATTQHLDHLYEASQKSISLLQERRTALIAAAVTGQMDIAGVLCK